MKTLAKRDRTTKDTLAALGALRLLIREVGGNYLATLQARVARVQQAVRNVPRDDTPDRRQIEQMAKMLRWMNNLDVKPQKGRRRDLRELDRLIAKLANTVDNW